MDLLAPSPNFVFNTRNGVFVSDANCIISAAPSVAVLDLIGMGCIPLLPVNWSDPRSSS
jgi:hypothetical protein